MKKHRLSTTLLMSTLCASSFGATATVITVAQAETGIMPVLVSVGSSGKVTKVMATEQLRPSYNRLLRKNIQEIVVGPANQNGRNTSSQVVMRMRLAVTPGPGGGYEARFVAVDTTPVPTGNWYWRIGDGRYALADYQSEPRFPSRNPIDSPQQANRFYSSPTTRSMERAVPAATQRTPSSPPHRGD